jgi:hypothetical protein
MTLETERKTLRVREHEKCFLPLHVSLCFDGVCASRLKDKGSKSYITQLKFIAHGAFQAFRRYDTLFWGYSGRIDILLK